MILEVDQNSKVQVPFFYNFNQLLSLPNRSFQRDTMLHHSSALDSSASQILHQAPQNSSDQHELRVDTVEGVAAQAHHPTHQKSINQHKSSTEATAPTKQDSISQLGKAANMILKTKGDDIQTIEQNMLDVSNNTAAKTGKAEVLIYYFLNIIIIIIIIVLSSRLWCLAAFSGQRIESLNLM